MSNKVKTNQLDLLFPAAIVKSLVEHGHVYEFFASTAAVGYHLEVAKDLGVIGENGSVTELGRRWYHSGLNKLPACRATHWGDIPPIPD